MRSLLHAARFLVALSVATDRRRFSRAVALMAIGYLATPAIALGLRELTNQALAGHPAPAIRYGLLVALLLVFELMMSHFAFLQYVELGELEELRLNEELISHANGTVGLEQLDRPEFADTIQLVRNEISPMQAPLEALLQLGGIGLQILFSTVLLGLLDPWLLLLPLVAVPPVIAGRRGQLMVQRATEATAEANRLAIHLLGLACTSAAVKEVRLFGYQHDLPRRQREAWSEVTSAIWRGQFGAALLRAAGQAFFALGYGLAIFLVVRSAAGGQSTIGDVVMVVVLAAQISAQVAGALGLFAALQTMGSTVERLERLRRWPGRTPRPVLAPAPARLRNGIRFEHVSFGYPGGGEILHDINLELPAGSTVAFVGENGAGKSTLVKLLCGLYLPTEGRILVDGVDLQDLPSGAWREHTAALFQDFAKLELTVRENVGIGDLARLDDDPAIGVALDDAGAAGIVADLPGGLSGFLGHNYTDGRELSGGQWQTLALARSRMRRTPLLLILDEPAAALDAAAEHRIFERYAESAAQAGGEGGITVFVSHRFSTIRMADQIVVLAAGTVADVGSHAELVGREGLYATLFSLQARAYT